MKQLGEEEMQFIVRTLKPGSVTRKWEEDHNLRGPSQGSGSPRPTLGFPA